MIESGKDINKNIFLLFCSLIVLQPFLNYYFLFSNTLKHYTLISPATIIQVLLIGVLFIYVWFTGIRRDRLTKYSTIYLVVLLIFSAVHLVVNLNFPVDLPGQYKYSLIDEANYLIRIMLPLMLLLVTLKIPLRMKHIRIITLSLVYIISATMIISNLLGFSLVAYQDNPVVNNSTFLSWFTQSSTSFNDMTSKGLFYKGNQLSGVLILLFPVNLMFFMKKATVISFFAAIIQILCLFMLGSRVGFYGAVISLAGVLIICAMRSLSKKKIFFSRRYALYCLIIIFFAGIYPFSPILVRNNDFAWQQERGIQREAELNSGNEEQPNSGNEEQPVQPMSEEEAVTALEAELSKMYIPSFFDKIYPVSADFDFWSKVAVMPYDQVNDNRKQEMLITQRIYSRIDHNKWLHSLLGMGRSRLASGGLLIESDFTLQRYTIGWAGTVLFFGPMVLLIVLCGIKMLHRFKAHFTLENTAIYLGIGLFFMASIFSGHLMDELFPVLLWVFFLGYLSRKMLIEKEPDLEGLE